MSPKDSTVHTIYRTRLIKYDIICTPLLSMQHNIGIAFYKSHSYAYLPYPESWLWHSRWCLMLQPRGWWFFQSGFSQRSAYLLAISALNAMWTLSGYCSQTGFFHLPVVFQQRSVAADLVGFLDNRNKWHNISKDVYGAYTCSYKEYTQAVWLSFSNHCY